jgi:sortase A
MRPAAETATLRRSLLWTQRVLFACAFLLLGYCGFALVDAWVFQKHESRDLDRLRDRRAARQGRPQAESSRLPQVAPPAATDALIGRLEIPRLGLSVMVVEGVGNRTLRRAAGHIPGTGLPGQSGNVGIAAHRDTFFRPLKDLRIHDEIRFSTVTGEFKYEVEWLKIVEPTNVGVLAPPGGKVLTLVTCYPFYYVGPAPQRWIVRARQVSPQASPPQTVK